MYNIIEIHPWILSLKICENENRHILCYMFQFMHIMQSMHNDSLQVSYVLCNSMRAEMQEIIVCVEYLQSAGKRNIGRGCIHSQH